MFQTYLQEHWLGLTFAVLGVVILFMLVVRYAGQTARFTTEVKVELKKASWPWDPKEKGAKRYKELIDSTLMVAIAMLLMGGYVAFWDFIMVNIVGALIK